MSREQQFLAEVGEALQASLDYATTIERIAQAGGWFHGRQLRHRCPGGGWQLKRTKVVHADPTRRTCQSARGDSARAQSSHLDGAGDEAAAPVRRSDFRSPSLRCEERRAFAAARIARHQVRHFRPARRARSNHGGALHRVLSAEPQVRRPRTCAWPRSSLDARHSRWTTPASTESRRRPSRREIRCSASWRTISEIRLEPSSCSFASAAARGRTGAV